MINAVVAGGRAGLRCRGAHDSGAAVWLVDGRIRVAEGRAGTAFHGAQMTAVAAGNGFLTAVGSDGLERWCGARLTGERGHPLGAASMTGAKAVGVAVGSTDDVVVGAVPGYAAMWSRDH